MRKTRNKILTSLIIMLFVMLGSCFIGNNTSVAHASSSNSISEELLDVLSVKYQLKENEDGTADLRMVSTVDGLASYKTAGFDIYIDGREEPIRYEKPYVSKRIGAKEDGVSFKYNPKVFDTSSNYFITVTVTDIPSSAYSRGFLIKPFVTKTGETERIYGMSRYVKVNDALEGQEWLSIPVERLENTTDYSVMIGSAPYSGSDVEFYNNSTNDSNYTHVRVKMDSSTLPSISNIGVLDAEGSNVVSTKYRNLISSSVDIDETWHEYADEDDKEYVLVTIGDLYGLANIVNSSSERFAEKKIYLGADITVNTGLATEWAEGKNLPTQMWTPIGGGPSSKETGSKFLGKFDGQGHTISGLYMKKAGDFMGLFGLLDTTSEIKNLRLVNTYFECTNTTKLGGETDGLGSIVGQGAGKLENIYSDAILVSEKWQVGGMAGNARFANLEMKNCWFDGKITGTYRLGGLVGFVNSGMNLTVTDSLVTADLKATVVDDYSVGGIAGFVGAYSNLYLTSCITVGTIESEAAQSGLAGYVYNYNYTRSATNCFHAMTRNGQVQAICNNASYITSTNVPTLTSAAALKGVSGYLNYLSVLDFYDENTNADGIWVLVKNEFPELRELAKTRYCSEPTSVAVADTSWYNNTDTVFTIDTVNELYGVAKLCNEGNTFEGKTIQLGSNISVNEGNAAEWAEGKNLPINDWIPIGGGTDSKTSGRPFKGNFDGQGYTISGVYAKLNAYYVGLFGYAGAGNTIQNFKLTNSYFENTATAGNGAENHGTGSIAGHAASTFDTIYSDAIVVSACTNTGGFVGSITVADALKIQNSWFAGKVAGTYWIGGLLGFAKNTGSNVTMENCLVTADLSCNNSLTYGAPGGLAGRSTGGTFTSCVTAGTISVTGGSATPYGFISNMNYNNNGGKTITMTNCYNTMTSNGALVDNNGGTPSSTNNIQQVKADAIKGTRGFAYYLSVLDCYDKNENTNGKWVVIKDELPEIRSFAKSEYLDDLSNYRLIVADTSWYNDTDTVFTIDTKNELYGLAKLCNEGNSFEGKTIKLGADITVNKGKATDWAEGKNIPVNEWTPIGGGTDSKTSGRAFKGNFDGQGYTISGLYTKLSAYYVGLFGYAGSGNTIQNFKLTNSYFENTATAGNGAENHGTGSIAGHASSTFDTIYSDAIVVSECTNTGGFVGSITVADALKVQNSWFAGKVSGTYWIGGLLGFAKNTGSNVTMENCLVTAELSCNNSLTYGAPGGLAGRSTGGAFTSCVTAGTISVAGGSATPYGFISNMNYNNNGGKTITMTNCYNTMTSNGALVANNGGTPSSTNNIQQVDADALKGTRGYAYYLSVLDCYDKNENANGKWVVVKDELPEIRSLAKSEYLDDLSDYRLIIADTSWYNDTDTVFTIQTPEELYGLAQLCNAGKIFSGKTVKLGANITVNKGKATDWAEGENLPVNEWTPIGGITNSSRRFAGIFDGQGHTISGLYMKSDGDFLGLFGWLENTSEVKNLKLLNTYFECIKTTTLGGETDGLGSIAGQGSGKLENIYSDAILVSQKWHVGGMVGCIRTISDALTLNVTNCWFNGSVKGTRWLGGIVGFAYTNSTTNISDCLVTADFKSTDTTTSVYATVGGVLGRGVLGTIKSCVVIGNVQSGYSQGGLVGTTITGNQVTAANCFHVMKKGTADQNTCLSGTLSSVQNVQKLTSADVLKGTSGYANYLSVLDVYDKNTNPDGKWVVVANELPTLRSFVQSEYITDVNAIEDKIPVVAVDTSWYNTADTEFTLYTAGQLYGFAKLCNDGNNFSGKTIKLGANIIANNGLATDWANDENLPINAWTPIGGITNSSRRFAGIFDGQGHTISGLYMKSEGDFLGLFGWLENTSEVKNFKLVNTYFECTKATTLGGETDGLGSIAGQGAGKLDNIYSDAILVSQKWHVGGMVGSIRTISDALTLNITNCSFVGSVKGTYWIGGIVGFVYANSTTNITDCLVFADFKTTDTTTNVYAKVGGITGRGVAGNITSCVAIGTVESSYSQGGLVGTAISGNTVKVTNCSNAITKGTTLQSTCLSGTLSSVTNVTNISDRGDENYIIEKADMTYADYCSYLTKLDNNAFAKYAENVLDGNADNTTGVWNAVYTKGELVITVIFKAKEGKLYVSIAKDQPLSEHLVYQEQYVLNNQVGAKTSLHMLDMDRVNAENYGNSFVIQLKNGHFIVNDGGMIGEAENLVKYLCYLAKGEKPVIEGWFISHGHSDHNGVLIAFYNNPELAQRVCVEGVYFVEAESTVGDYSGVVKPGILGAKKCRTSNGEVTPIYRPQTGQRYYFNDITIDVLHTHEQLSVDVYTEDFNDSSSWLLYNIENQTFLHAGDAAEGSIAVVKNSYNQSYLSFDVMATFHHGQGIYDSYIDYFTYKTVLYTTFRTASQKSELHQLLENNRLKANASEYMSWGDGTKILTFPYQIGTAQSVFLADIE